MFYFKKFLAIITILLMHSAILCIAQAENWLVGGNSSITNRPILGPFNSSKLIFAAGDDNQFPMILSSSSSTCGIIGHLQLNGSPCAASSTVTNPTKLLTLSTVGGVDDRYIPDIRLGLCDYVSVEEGNKMIFYGDIAFDIMGKSVNNLTQLTGQGLIIAGGAACDQVVMTNRYPDGDLVFGTTPDYESFDDTEEAKDIERMRIYGNGTIKMSIPASEILEITGGYVRINSLSTGTSNYDQVVGGNTSGTLTKIHIYEKDGKIGIGNNNPAQELDVLGDVVISGGLLINESATITGMANGDGAPVLIDDNGVLRKGSQNGITEWLLDGNNISSGDFLGTNNNNALVFKTFQKEALRISPPKITAGSSTISGSVGINTGSDPSATFHIHDGNVLFDGTSGGTPVSGAGTRLMWIPDKAAFRAGKVINNNTAWDEQNIGQYSVAFGLDNQASGEGSSAFGASSFASGKNSFAASGRADGFCSVAMGGGAIASGDLSVALGGPASAEGLNSFAGAGGGSFGDFSISLGNGCNSSSFSSVSIGHFSLSSNSYTLALGNSLDVSGLSAVGIGSNSTSSGDYSSVIGHNATTNGKYGSFIMTDGSTANQVISRTTNQMTMRFVGSPSGSGILDSAAYRFFTNAGSTLGVFLSPNGSQWQNLSDRDMKENFKEIDYHGIINSLRRIPLSTWNYKDAVYIKCMGPMAQDFYREFKLGSNGDSLSIGSLNIDGVNMAGIKALILRTDSLVTIQKELIDRSNKSVDNTTLINKLQSENTELRLRVELLEEKLNKMVESNSNYNDCFEDIKLEQNIPNPFDGITEIKCIIPEKYGKSINLIITDASGLKEVQRMSLTSGIENIINVSANDFETGAYIYGIVIDGKIVKSKKMLIIK